ncbi:MAG: hypothetical protein K2O06_10170 [Acetatifactor sp.]|nr:hypothetical protein [Acetatifactor sp.]
MKIIEAWGTGLGRIRNSCREYGLPEPIIEESGDGFRVIFYRKAVHVDRNVGNSIENRLIELLIQYPAITQQEAILHRRGSTKKVYGL